MNLPMVLLMSACGAPASLELPAESEPAAFTAHYGLAGPDVLIATPDGTEIVTPVGHLRIGDRLLGIPAVSDDGTRAVVALRGDAFESILVALQRDGTGWQSRPGS